MVVQDVEPGALLAVGPHPSRPHGQGMSALPLPLLSLLQQAEVAGDGRPRVINDLVHALEDVFSCPGTIRRACGTCNIPACMRCAPALCVNRRMMSIAGIRSDQQPLVIMFRRPMIIIMDYLAGEC